MRLSILPRKGKHTLRKLPFYLTVILSGLLILAACDKDDHRTLPGNDDDDEIPVKAPDFRLRTLNGDFIALSELENKVVVLFFFGHACAPCRTAAVSVESKLHKPHAWRDDYVVLGLEVSNANTAAVESFRSLTGSSFPLLLDASYTANAYETTLDRLIIINRSGYIHHRSSQSAGCDMDIVSDKVGILLGN